MTFKIATGAPEAPRTKSGMVDDGLNVDLSNGTRAERLHRQIIDNIEACETSLHLMGYWMDEGTVLTAMQRSWPEFHALAHDRYETQLAVLIGCERPSSAPAEPRPAEPGFNGSARHSAIEESVKMFHIDTGNTGGSKGPWLSWTSEGSARKGHKPESWVFRHKEEGSLDTTEEAVPAFVNGCVMDLDSLKLGWEKDGAAGQAPERRWNPSVGQATQRPDDSKKASGGYAWSQALSVRLAIGGGRAATWEQSAFGAYEAFTKLSRQIMAEWEAKSDNGKLLPLVKQNSVERRKMAKGSTSIPVLEIERWVARPDCLKADAPTISTAPTPAPQPAPQPVPQPAPQAQTTPADTSAVAEDVEF